MRRIKWLMDSQAITRQLPFIGRLIAHRFLWSCRGPIIIPAMLTVMVVVTTGVGAGIMGIGTAGSGVDSGARREWNR